MNIQLCLTIKHSVVLDQIIIRDLIILIYFVEIYLKLYLARYLIVKLY